MWPPLPAGPPRALARLKRRWLHTRPDGFLPAHAIPLSQISLATRWCSLREIAQRGAYGTGLPRSQDFPLREPPLRRLRHHDLVALRRTPGYRAEAISFPLARHPSLRSRLTERRGMRSSALRRGAR